MIRPVLRMGDARLLRRSREVAQFDTSELHELITDMFETMYHTSGVGLAAPQIGVDLRVVVFGFDQSERYPEADAVPRTILINPILEPLSDAQEDGWEGCLSVPDMRGVVPRYVKLRYSGFDLSGQPIGREIDGFHARVVQHECDHLDGILYPMRIRDFAYFGFTDVLFPGQDIAED